MLVRVLPDNDLSDSKDDVRRPAYEAFREAVAAGEVAYVWTVEQSPWERREVGWFTLAAELDGAGIEQVNTRSAVHTSGGIRANTEWSTQSVARVGGGLVSVARRERGIRVAGRNGLNGPDDEFEAILREGLVFPVFQPVVALADQRPVGFEALARGPEGSRYHTPGELFGAAARWGRTIELGWLTATVALRDAMAADLTDVATFVNLDPETLGSPCPPQLSGDYEAALRDLDVVIEMTEHAVRRNPSAQLAAVVHARSLGARVALDDVGADRITLAAMPLIRPDIIKIDRGIIQGHSPNWAVSRVMNAIWTEAQHTGAQILAEGVESKEHLELSESLGATLAQGWRFGRPDQLPPTVTPSRTPLARVATSVPVGTTPFAIVMAAEPVQHATEQNLATLNMHIENQALHSDDPTVLFVNVAEARHYDNVARTRFEYMAGRGVEVVVLGRGLPASSAPGVRYSPLADDDPLADERCIILIGSHVMSGVFARRRPGADTKCYDTIISHDRSRVLDAAQLIVQRLTR